MARTYSWLPRLHEIRKTVAESPRSHYTRADIQDLFQVQQSGAARLMEALPTVRMNLGLLVEREALVAFLDKANEADDVTALIEEMKKARRAPSRKAMRSMVRRTYDEVGFEGLPANVELRRGYVGIKFETLDELVTAQFVLARLLMDEMDEFARRYEPQAVREPDEAGREVRQMFAELEEMERQAA